MNFEKIGAAVRSPMLVLVSCNCALLSRIFQPPPSEG